MVIKSIKLLHWEKKQTGDAKRERQREKEFVTYLYSFLLQFTCEMILQSDNDRVLRSHKCILFDGKYTFVEFHRSYQSVTPPTPGPVTDRRGALCTGFTLVCLITWNCKSSCEVHQKMVPKDDIPTFSTLIHWLGFFQWIPHGAFTLDVKSVLNENLGGILGGTQC
jgi:hypothetical protein